MRLVDRAEFNGQASGLKRYDQGSPDCGIEVYLDQGVSSLETVHPDSRSAKKGFGKYLSLIAGST